MSATGEEKIMDFHLGIDIGTTSIKVCVKSGPETVASSRRVHEAYNKTFVGKNHVSGKLFREQDPKILLQTVDLCMKDLRIIDSNMIINSISVTGQMHGVVLWKPKIHNAGTVDGFSSILDHSVERNSNLITWEDQRCDETFLQSLPKTTLSPVATGYGLASLLWLHRHDQLNSFTMCGSIMDFLVWLLTQKGGVHMTPHNAKSWGYFDEDKMEWDINSLNECGFNCTILPSIIPVCQPVGASIFSCYGFTKAVTVVYGGLGDMQCAIRACNPQAHEAVLNIGTSSQLSMIVNKESLKDIKEFRKSYPALDVVPYLHDKAIITAASLTGGNVIVQFAWMLRDWATQLGCQNVPENNEIFSKFESLLTSSSSQQQQLQQQNQDQAGPVIIPRLYGERYAPHTTASVTNITPTNLSLGETVGALHKGIIENLLEMMPRDLMLNNGIKRIVGTGGTLTANKFLQMCITDNFGFPLRISGECDAAEGAAMFNE